MKKEGIIRSMTGFGKGSARGLGCACFAEIKSVNHRYLDVNTKIPDELQALDLEVKKLLKSCLKRGAVYLNLNFIYEGGIDLEIDNVLFRKLLKLEKEIERKHGISQPLNIHYILSYPGVVRQVHPQVPFKTKRELVLSAVRAALQALLRSREKEGANLRKDLEVRIERIQREIHTIALLEEERERDLIRKMQEQMQSLAEEGLPLTGGPPSTHEEVVRLKSHIKAAKSLLKRGGVIGRELDFLAQEMTREVNTLSAKALSSRTSNLVVKIKTEIEKIREQALNIE